MGISLLAAFRVAIWEPHEICAAWVMPTLSSGDLQSIRGEEILCLYGRNTVDQVSCPSCCCLASILSSTRRNEVLLTHACLIIYLRKIHYWNLFGKSEFNFDFDDEDEDDDDSILKYVYNHIFEIKKKHWESYFLFRIFIFLIKEREREKVEKKRKKKKKRKKRFNWPFF